MRELVLLFKAVDEQQRADASPEAPRAVVSPNGLREALSHTAEFKLGAATAVLASLMWPFSKTRSSQAQSVLPGVDSSSSKSLGPRITEDISRVTMFLHDLVMAHAHP